MLMVVLWELRPVPVVELLPTIAVGKSGNVKTALKPNPGPSGEVCVLEAITAPRLLSSVARMAYDGVIRDSSSSSEDGRNEDRRLAAGRLALGREVLFFLKLIMSILLELTRSRWCLSRCLRSGRETRTPQSPAV
jgi:hypothetical protein